MLLGAVASLVAAAVFGGGNASLRTLLRPPPHTSVQDAVLRANVANAAAESEDARDELLGLLSCSSEKCAGMSSDELLALLEYEFKRLPLIHNGPRADSEDEETGGALEAWQSISQQTPAQRRALMQAIVHSHKTARRSHTSQKIALLAPL